MRATFAPKPAAPAAVRVALVQVVHWLLDGDPAIRWQVMRDLLDAPAAQVAAGHVRAAYDDRQALARFAEAVDVATYEFENIPVAPLAVLGDKLRPGIASLEIAQDRAVEKRFIERSGARVTPWTFSHCFTLSSALTGTTVESAEPCQMDTEGRGPACEEAARTRSPQSAAECVRP